MDEIIGSFQLLLFSRLIFNSPTEIAIDAFVRPSSYLGNNNKNIQKICIIHF